MSDKGSRLGSLLSTPVPAADEDASFAAHQAKKGTADTATPLRLWQAVDTRTYDEVARVEAADEKGAIKAVQERGRRGNFTVSEIDPATGQPLHPRPRPAGRLADRGAPVVLPRERRKRVPKEKLTVQLPAVVIDALTDLVDRDGTLRYDEVEAALRKHLRSKGIVIEDEAQAALQKQLRGRGTKTEED